MRILPHPRSESAALAVARAARLVAALACCFGVAWASPLSPLNSTALGGSTEPQEPQEPQDEEATPGDGLVQEPPPIVVGLDVKGLQLREPERIAARLGLRVGEPLPSMGEFTQRLTRLYDDFRILEAQGGYKLEEVEGGVIVHLALIEMPYDLEPQFVGNTRFDVEQLREWAGFGDRVMVFTDEVEGVADKILRAYRRQGYHFVEIEPRLSGQGVQEQEIVFEIREGPKVYVTSVQIEGNESYKDEGILIWRQGLKSIAGVQSKGRGLFAWWGHRYVEEVLQGDVIAIAQAYRRRGFLDVVVDPIVEFTEDRSGATVRFVIDEGPQYTVESIDIRAFEIEPDPVRPDESIERAVDLILPEEELEALLALKVGEPFEDARVLYDRRQLLDRYGEEGHLERSSFVGESGTAGWHWLGLDAVADYVNKTVRVTYRIQQGRPFTLRILEIQGNDNTKDHVIRSRVSQLPGQRIDGERMRADRARIERTQFFSDNFTGGDHPPPSISYRTVPGSPDLVDAIITVKEGRTINANLSGGLASDQGLVGIVSLTINNFDAGRFPTNPWATFGEVYRKDAFTGNGETLGIDVSPGSEVSYARLFYQHPDIFSRFFDPIGLIFEVQQRDRLFRSHDEQRTFGRVAVTRGFAQGDLQASLGVRWQLLDHDDFDPNDPLPRTLIQSEGEEQFFGLTTSLSYNALDNVRLPRSGYAARWENTIYGDGIGSDRNLWKTELSYDRYFHLSRDPFDAAPGIYLGLGAGVAVPFDDARGSVNYGERFFFGGARIGRAFRFRGIGPYEGDFPLGGETFLRGTLEYRFPLYTQSVPGVSRSREVFRGSFFIDTVTLDPNAYEMDLQETRVAAGFAIGLIEPFPVTFSFGWPLRSEPEDERQVFSFSLTLR